MLRSNYWLEVIEYKAKRSVQALLNVKSKTVVVCASGPCNCGDGGDGGNGSPCDGSCGSGDSD